MKKINTAKIIIIGLCLLFFSTQALAVMLPNPLAAKDFKTIVDTIVNFVIILAVAIAPIFIIYAGYLFMTSGGDPTKVKIAKNVIMYVVIGLAVLLLSKGLIMVLISVIGVDKGLIQ